MLRSMWFKVFVITFVGLQLASCNFEEFVENEDLSNEDFNNNSNDTNIELATTGKRNHTGIFRGTISTFTKNVGNILPKLLLHFESTTPNKNQTSFEQTQLTTDPPQGSLISKSVSTLIRLPYEGARTAKDLLLKGIHQEGGGVWDRNADHSKEHGNTERFGREFVRKIVNAFGRSDTQGLDTNTTFFSGVMDKFKDYVRFIYPGTVWCGEGDAAGKSSDLGVFAEPDKCCRNHDKCHNYIEKGAKKYGLENTGMFTRSHCSCDRNFHNCLKDSKSAVGLQIGITYFTVLGPQCFEETQKIEGCNKTLLGRCIKYIFNKSKEKKYQWLDNPTF